MTLLIGVEIGVLSRLEPVKALRFDGKSCDLILDLSVRFAQTVENENEVRT